MAYNEKLAQRVREILLSKKNVEEKKMMGGLTFMVNDKMCAGIIKDELMARIDPEVYDIALTKTGCRPMDFTGKVMRGFVLVGAEAISTKKNLNFWIALALDFNKKKAESSKKKR